MKQLVQKLVGKFGYSILRTSTVKGGEPGSTTRPIGKLNSFLEDIHARGFRPKGIIDVGANKGAWAKLALSIFPGTPVIMIEPLDEMSPFLSEFAGVTPNCFYIKAGAGRSAGELIQTIDEGEGLEGSSFLPSQKTELEKQGRQRKTRIVKMDDVCLKDYPKFVPDLVKLDIQGFELEALSGAETLFGKTEIFILEVSLFPFEPGWPIVREVISFMSARGYEIYDIAGFLRRPYDGALGQMDLVFAKADGIFRKTTKW